MADVQYLDELFEFHNYLAFLPEGMKIEIAEKLVANFHDKKEYVIHIINLKQTLNHGLELKRVHRNAKLNQEYWLKSYIYMNTELKKMQKIILKNIFSS